MEKDKSAGEQDTLMYPLMEDLLKKIPSKFEVVVLASLRARQIIQKQRQGLSFERELDAEATLGEDVRKPLSRALAEIAEGKLDKDKMYLLEYLESFRRGDETASVPVPPEDAGLASTRGASGKRAGIPPPDEEGGTLSNPDKDEDILESEPSPEE